MLTNLMRKIATLARPAALPVVRVGGRIWQMTPAGVELLGPGGPDLDGWLSAGRAVVVKATSSRTVYRVELPGGAVFVKHCRVTGPRGWAREAIRPPKAQLEFENALDLRSRGVETIEPLAWGGLDSNWPGENFLITRAMPAVPFRRYIDHVLPTLPPDEQPAVRRQLARGFGEFLAKLHDAGVTHPDPHAGNLLVEVPPSRVPHFALIDLHAICLGSPLTWEESRANLAIFNRWFQFGVSRADRTRCWRAYCLARTTLPPLPPDEAANGAKQLERDTLASNLRFWAGRDGRCLGSNRYFRRARQGNVRGFAVRDLPADFLAELLRDPDAVFQTAGVNAARDPGAGQGASPPASVLKVSPSSTVVELTMPTPCGPVPVVFKRVVAPSWLDGVKNLLRPSHVLRSWANGHAMLDRWLPTPRPLAVFHRYQCGLPRDGYLLTAKVPAPVALDEAVRRCPDRAARRDILGRVARVLRGMHDRGVSHRDLKAANILLADGTDPVLVDLVGVRVRVSPSPGRRARELARLNVSFLASPRITRGDRLWFLRAYLSAGPALQGGWKIWWEMVSRATAAKVAKNRRAGRMLG